MEGRNRSPIEVLVVVLVAMAAARLVGFLIVFGEQSLQMDFSAYYTAGEALNAGLNPYENHYARENPIWDGVAEFRHSRYLYPPLVAALFRPVALIPYHAAKHLWAIANLLSVAIAMFMAWRLTSRRLTGALFWLPVLALLLFHPLLTMLERGQIDGITLAFATWGIVMLSEGKRRGAAGALLAVATVLKLHTLLIVPFLVVRRQWRTLGAYCAGLVAALALSLLVCGVDANRDYALEQFPRISEHGEGGTDDMLGDSAIIASLKSSDGRTSKGGRAYRPYCLDFVWNASIVWTPIGLNLGRFLKKVNLPSSPSVVSLLLFSVCFALFLLAQWRAGFPVPASPREEFLYWQLAVVLMLVCAPLTWTMNVVWLAVLLPFAVDSLSARTPTGGARSAAGVLTGLGLILAVLPGHKTFGLLLPFRFLLIHVGSQQYVIAELAVAIGLGLYLGSKATRRPPSPEEAKGLRDSAVGKNT